MGWAERIGRARYLAGLHPEAAALLTFYAALADYQRLFAERCAPTVDDQPLAYSFPDCIDTRLVLDAVPDTLSWLERSGPAGPAANVDSMRAMGSADWRALFGRYLTGRGVGLELELAPPVFVLEALLQPIAERLAGRSKSGPAAGDAGNRCPFCASLPIAGVLREEGHGTKRSLVCGLCLSEWTYPRVACVACDERGFDSLPVYTAEQFASARIETCETCRTYIKTIDASKDGHAIPLVDDLASVSLDLWAREQGYVRVRENLMRT
jgi:formate dehydrogenase accessory protein FdhE